MARKTLSPNPDPKPSILFSMCRYFSRKALLNKRSREAVLLPDRRPLPSIVDDLASLPAVNLTKLAAVEKPDPESDEDFLRAFEVSAWFRV